ncbi:MAG: GNAT family N-acetyltransferase [Alphaproteobacteria bacterium]|nr:GNAT family N-acetyltransferase [Alphaproteobacteria bacterium]MBL6936881.1 GNAT family N-acetyltransferase [Alphaproteobacteria bacterium]MBL7097650.1 GNAT family N-acetyltransferase [Alphaproteobacteria bacterium]
MSFHPTTPRLILRAPTLADMPAFVAILNDYEVAKNLRMVAHPFTEAMFREALVRIDRERRDGAAYSLAVTRAMDGALIGMCAVERGEDGVCEFGYWYGRRFWGQGYATEAARPVMRFAFEDMGAERLTAGWFEDNPASGHVLAKLGFTVTGVARVFSVGRNCEVTSNRVLLTAEQFARKKAA